MFKTFIFDLDNTLYDYTFAHDNAINSVISYISTTYNYPDSFGIYEKYKQQLKIDVLSTSSCHARSVYFKNMLREINVSDNPIILNDIYWQSFYENIHIYDGVLDLLELLASKNINICMATNFTTEHQLRKLKIMNIHKYFTHIVTSEEVLLEKPNPAMFHKIINLSDCLSSECIMIGDSHHADILPSLLLGMSAVHIDHSQSQTLQHHSTYMSVNSLWSLYSYIHDILNELHIFSEMSRYIGERFDLVQAGGGNISFKSCELMFIKSSGARMSTINMLDGYSVVQNTHISTDISNDVYKPATAYTYMKKQKPSIETYMHSFMKKYTVHIHPLQILNHLVLFDDDSFLQQHFPSALIIPYITPGYGLAQEIYKQYNNHSVIFLKNHGIIVTSDDHTSLLDTLNNIVRVCDTGNLYLNYKTVNTISSSMSYVYSEPFCSLLVQDDSITQHVLNTSYAHTFFPDKAVYCGHNFLRTTVVNPGVIETFICEYDEQPKIFIVNDNVYIVSKTLQKCHDIQDVLKSHIIISNQTNIIKPLDDVEIQFLLHWEEELYRSSLNT